MESKELKQALKQERKRILNFITNKVYKPPVLREYDHFIRATLIASGLWETSVNRKNKRARQIKRLIMNLKQGSKKRVRDDKIRVTVHKKQLRKHLFEDEF